MGSFQAHIIHPVSDAEKQERAAWLSEADVEFFTGGGPSGQPSSSEEQPVDPEMQSTVQVPRCCTTVLPLLSQAVLSLSLNRCTCSWPAETACHWRHSGARPRGLWPHPDGAAAVEAGQTDVLLCRASVAN